MRFLLDTNILIPLDDSEQVLEASLANFVRLAHENNHVLLYHPASEDDFLRDSNPERRRLNLDGLKKYTRLPERPACPWNTVYTRPNDAVDNELLYALHGDAVHALVSEDRSLHDKARDRGLPDRIHTIQTAEDWLRRLHDAKHVQLPDIGDVSLDSLTPLLDGEFFHRLGESDPGLHDWLSDKAREGRRAWVAWEREGVPAAICIYTRQDSDVITEEGLRLDGAALELSTFTVSPAARGRKIGELFLNAAFRYATANRLENIVIHGDAREQHVLFTMLEDFGFSLVGSCPGSSGRDAVYCKRHPGLPPSEIIEPFEYLRRYFPHFRHDSDINKLIIPIRPRVHTILFPDYQSPAGRQLSLFARSSTAGNAIRLACLCHARISRVNAGDVVLFYRSGDERAVTSLGVVESCETLRDASLIAGRVGRRTVYSMKEIEQMAAKPTKVILFRLVKHLLRPLPQSWLEVNDVLRGAPQGITRISHEAFERVLAAGA